MSVRFHSQKPGVLNLSVVGQYKLQMAALEIKRALISSVKANMMSAIKRRQKRGIATRKRRLCGAGERRKSANENHKSVQFVAFLSSVFSATAETCAFSTTINATRYHRYALTKFTLARPEISIVVSQ